jgi:hypothetical protein
MGQKLRPCNRGDLETVLETMKEAALPQTNGNSFRDGRERQWHCWNYKGSRTNYINICFSLHQTAAKERQMFAATSYWTFIDAKIQNVLLQFSVSVRDINVSRQAVCFGKDLVVTNRKGRKSWSKQGRRDFVLRCNSSTCFMTEIKVERSYTYEISWYLAI